MHLLNPLYGLHHTTVSWNKGFICYPDSKCVTTVKGRIQSFLFIPECILICFAEKYICRGGERGFYLCFVCVFEHTGIPYTTVYQSLGSSKGTIFWQTFNSHLADFIDCGSRSASEAARELVAKEKKGTAAAFLIKSGQWSFHYHVGCFCLTKILRVVVLKENYSFFKLSSSLTPCHLSLSWSCSSAEAFP